MRVSQSTIYIEGVPHHVMKMSFENRGFKQISGELRHDFLDLEVSNLLKAL